MEGYSPGCGTEGVTIGLGQAEEEEEISSRCCRAMGHWEGRVWRRAHSCCMRFSARAFRSDPRPLRKMARESEDMVAVSCCMGWSMDGCVRVRSPSEFDGVDVKVE